jgi:hypothetical protein
MSLLKQTIASTLPIILTIPLVLSRSACAQTGGCQHGTTTTNSSLGTSATSAQLAALVSTLQRMLQSGTLTAAQQQRVAALLSRLENIQAGAGATPAQVRQPAAALAAAQQNAARAAMATPAFRSAGAQTARARAR